MRPAARCDNTPLIHTLDRRRSRLRRRQLARWAADRWLFVARFALRAARARAEQRRLVLLETWQAWSLVVRNAQLERRMDVVAAAQSVRRSAMTAVRRWREAAQARRRSRQVRAFASLAPVSCHFDAPCYAAASRGPLARGAIAPAS